jgi:hypothetical protein
MIKIDLTKIASHKTPIFAEKTRKNGHNTPCSRHILRPVLTVFGRRHRRNRAPSLRPAGRPGRTIAHGCRIGTSGSDRTTFPLADADN